MVPEQRALVNDLGYRAFVALEEVNETRGTPSDIALRQDNRCPHLAISQVRSLFVLLSQSDKFEM